jgi:hypothetical protein
MRELMGAVVFGIVASIEVVAAQTPEVTVTPSPTLRRCVGDCDANGIVAVHELIAGVNIALGIGSVDVCADFDTGLDRRVSVDELIAGVGAALDGCDPSAGRFPVGACFWPDHAYGQTGSALGDLSGFGLNTVVAYYEYVKPDVPPFGGQPDCHGLVGEAERYGIDFFIGSPRGEELQGADDAEITARLRATVDCVGPSPRYRGWMFDEPELTGYDPPLLDRVIRILRVIDAQHRVWVNFNPYLTDEQFVALGKDADMLGFDIYPILEGDGSGLPNLPLTDVGELARRAVSQAPQGGDVWMIVQGFGYSDLPDEGGKGRRPTPSELRFMVYDALLSGARGIAFFGSHQLRNTIPLEEPLWDNGVRTLAGELRAVGPVLLAGVPTDEVTATPGVIVTRAVGNDDAELLLAANTTDSNVDAVIRFGRAVFAAQEIFDGYVLRVEDDAIRDGFAPHGVHVYRIER